jgi:hypothetical protein
MASQASAPAAALAVDASFSVTKFWNETFVGKLSTATGSELLVKCLSVKEDDSTAYKVFVIGLTILTGIVTLPALIVIWDKLSSFCSSAASSVRAQQNAVKPPAEAPKPAASDAVKPPVEDPKPAANAVKPPVEDPKPAADAVKPPVEDPKPAAAAEKPAA